MIILSITILATWYTLKAILFKIPSLQFINWLFFFSIEEYPQPYCGIVDGMAMACLEMSILELFGRGGEYSAETDAEIEELTDQQVLHAINSRQRCGSWFGSLILIRILNPICKIPYKTLIRLDMKKKNWYMVFFLKKQNMQY